MLTISIVIPAFNESENIGELVAYLLKEGGDGLAEVIVSDGGSADETVRRAAQAGALAVLSPQKGRAAQMNYGASLAKGDILYFLHADGYPPASFVKDIETAVKEGFGFGRYRTRFDSGKWILKVNAFFTRFRSVRVLWGRSKLVYDKGAVCGAGRVYGINADHGGLRDRDKGKSKGEV